MKRVIKFRAKRPDDGKWVFGDFKHHQRVTITGLEPTILVDNDPVILETIGQFTGLLDKNGKEIYEGDILLLGEEWDGNTGSVAVYNEVGFKDGCFGYIGERSGKLLPFCHNEVTEEIAGNIHDNPELLKGGKE